VLAKLPSIEIAPEKRPRMADFAALGEAVFRVSGKDDGDFLKRYNTMRKDGVHRTIDSSSVGAALLGYLHEVPTGWDGTLSDLLSRLEHFRPHGETWPRSAKGLGDALRRLAPALRMIGFECKSEAKTGGSIRWLIFSSEKRFKQSPASPACPAQSADIDQKARHAGHAGHGFEVFQPEETESADTEMF